MVPAARERRCLHRHRGPRAAKPRSADQEARGRLGTPTSGQFSRWGPAQPAVGGRSRVSPHPGMIPTRRVLSGCSGPARKGTPVSPPDGGFTPAPPPAGPRNRVPPMVKKRGDGLERRPPAGTARRRRAESRIATSRHDSHSARPQRVQWSRPQGNAGQSSRWGFTPAPRPAGWSDRHRPPRSSHSGPLSPQTTLVGEAIPLAAAPHPERIPPVRRAVFVQIAADRAPHGLGSGKPLSAARLGEPFRQFLRNGDVHPHREGS